MRWFQLAFHAVFSFAVIAMIIVATAVIVAALTGYTGLGCAAGIVLLLAAVGLAAVIVSAQISHEEE